MAFLYDPMVRESPRSSHIVDWGSHETNLEVERRVTADKASPVFHTFIFPLEKEAWYYVGALRWTPMPLKDIWESLLPKVQEKAVSPR
ncbi:hypothetical protein OE88DRAFT_1651920 [Heliocybe sulcata]|uniref:Uncharacterized protein n=1 Tax=Heliocybe sulcata TaxID=5364 RepID=A0A5C3NDV7_9AGAM|nr:hypothetical protein OE88DRAFT_1651920 [Heliocybe sulcata]